MIGTDENRAVLYVEAIFWSGKRKTPPSLMSGNIVPILSSKEPRNIWGYAFWTETSVHLMNRLWGMPNPSIQIPLTTLRWKTMRSSYSMREPMPLAKAGCWAGPFPIK